MSAFQIVETLLFKCIEFIASISFDLKQFSCLQISLFISIRNWAFHLRFYFLYLTILQFLIKHKNKFVSLLLSYRIASATNTHFHYYVRLLFIRFQWAEIAKFVCTPLRLFLFTIQSFTRLCVCVCVRLGVSSKR